MPSSGKKKPREIIIRSSLLCPRKALEIGEILAGVRGNLIYNLSHIEEGKWKVVITRGNIGDLLNAINTTKSIEVVRDSIPPEFDIDISDL